jgi:antitoxin MazE
MECMRPRSSMTKRLSEPEIDQIVIAQADDGASWEQPMRVRRAEISLDALLARVAEANRHGEISTGPAVGGEVW